MFTNIKFIIASLTAVLMVPAVALAATTTTKVVTPVNTQGFVFNRDSTNATPYEFTQAQHSTGNGSLYIKPIGPNPASKFIAEKALGSLVSDINSFSYDFLIAGNGTVASAPQFYLNVYTLLPGHSVSYDCRYDYTPLAGSTTNFTTAIFTPANQPSFVNPKNGATCPATLALLPTGSTVKGIAINVGDTSTSDVSLAGYLDNVVISTKQATTVYDFELKNVPTSAKQCKDNGFASLTDDNGNGFKNQGQCIKFVKAQNSKSKNDIRITNNNNQSATSGNANSNNNTQGSSAQSGDASNTNKNDNTATITNKKQ